MSPPPCDILPSLTQCTLGWMYLKIPLADVCALCRLLVRLVYRARRPAGSAAVRRHMYVCMNAAAAASFRAAAWMCTCIQDQPACRALTIEGSGAICLCPVVLLYEQGLACRRAKSWWSSFL